MKLYSDLSLNSNDLSEIKTLQLNKFNNTASTPADVPIGTLYFDGNVVDDSNTNDAPIDSSKLVKSGLKLKFKVVAENTEAEWLYFLAGYQYAEGTSPTVTLIKRYNLDGGRLLNANITPRFASELVCKSYVDGLIGGKFTKTFDCNGTDTAFTHTVTGNVNTLTLYERTGSTSFTYTVVLADISMVVTTANSVVTSVITVTFSVAPTDDKYFELRGA